MRQGALPAAADWARDRGVALTDAAEHLREYDHLTLVRLVLAEHRAHPVGGAPNEALGLLDRLREAAATLRARRQPGRDRPGQGARARRRRPAAAGADAPSPTPSPWPPNPRATPGSSSTRANRPWRCCGRRPRDAGRRSRRDACSRRGAPDRGRPPSRGPASGRLADPLSERELQVLRLLDSELSGPEIARELFISPNTLRTHTKHVFTKLGVTSRRAAVARARERGLLSADPRLTISPSRSHHRVMPGHPVGFVGFEPVPRHPPRTPAATEAVMQITTTKLTRAAGLAAVAAGALFIAVQVKHPEITLDFVQTTQWKVRQGMKIAMAVLALAGITGMYLRQVRQIGVLGLVGYLLFSVGYLVMLCVEIDRAWSSSRPSPQTSPDYVNGVLAVATNSSSTADLGLFRPLNMVVAGSATSLGGLVFGIALFRAGVLARWAAALLAVAAVATMAIPLLPMVNQRLFAVPNGVALIGLGWSLWREQRAAAAEPVTTPSTHGSTRPAPDDPPDLDEPHPAGAADRVGAVRARRPRRHPGRRRVAAARRARRRPAPAARQPPDDGLARCRSSCTCSAPCRTPCSAPSSSRRGCAAGTRAGTGRPGRSSWPSACWSRSPACG